MGIKMNRARYNGQEIKISEYDVNKVYGKLKCYYCDADISFVNSHERDLGERKIIIQKYFRLLLVLLHNLTSHHKNNVHKKCASHTQGSAFFTLFSRLPHRQQAAYRKQVSLA